MGQASQHLSMDNVGLSASSYRNHGAHSAQSGYGKDGQCVGAAWRSIVC
jgi:hypothetical protein